MCNKSGFISFSLFIFLWSMTSNAQSVFNNFNNTPSTNVAAAPGSQQVNPVMSPGDFQKTVNKLGQQNLNDLSQQVTQQMTKSAPLNNKNMPSKPPVNNSFTAPPSSTVISQPESTGAKDDVYTGFNFQNSNTNTPGSATKGTNNAGDWNIKY